jgi:hypothetical protein
MVTPEDRALLNDDYFIFGTSFVLCDGDGTARRLAPEDCFINPRKKENA